MPALFALPLFFFLKKTWQVNEFVESIQLWFGAREWEVKLDGIWGDRSVGDDDK